MSNYPLTYAELKAINQGLVTARREDQHRIKKLEAENLDLLRDLSISIEHNEQLQAAITNFREGNYPNPRSHRPNPCLHGTQYWQECESCSIEYWDSVLPPESEHE